MSQKRKNDDDLSSFLPSFGKKSKTENKNDNDLSSFLPNFGKQAREQNNKDKAMENTRKKKVEVKDKARYAGPDAPDRIYVYGVDSLPEAEKANDAEMKEELDEEVYDDENPYKIPFTHEVELKGHLGHVSACAIDPSGSRLLTGGYDSVIKFWDFNAMDASLKSFRTIEPETDIITNLNYSPTGDRFIMGSNSPQARVFNREGKEIALFPKGYPYISDMASTKGHITKVTSAYFNPDGQHAVTSSHDCTVRIWDLNNFKQHSQIIKLRNSQGAVKSGVSCSAINPKGSMIAAVCVDGSLQFFPYKGPFTRASMRYDNAHEFGSETSSVLFSKDEYTVVTRGGDDTMKVWDTRKLATGPIKSFDDIPNRYQETDVVFSPDESVFCTGTSVSKDVEIGKLVFVEKKSLEIIKEVNVTDNSVISLLWHPKLNQIFAGCTDHKMHVLYNPELSTKGMLYCVVKHPKREKYEDFVAVKNIQSPHALPMFRDNKSTRRAKEKAKSDPTRAAIPQAPQIGPGAGGRIGSNTTASIMAGLVKKTEFDNDPRAALLKYHDDNGLKEMAIYKQTQPVPIFLEEKEEEEGEEKK